MTGRCTRIACWVPKATNTHSVYIIIIAFPLQQCLYERASLLRYTYIDRLFRLAKERRKRTELAQFVVWLLDGVRKDSTLSEDKRLVD